MAQALPFIYLGATIAAGAATAVQQRRAGKLQEIGMKQEAKQEEMSARDREIDRRRQLVRALASQNAEAGAWGLDQSSGSRRALTLEDVRLARMDDLTDRAMSSRRATNLRSGARNARSSGNTAAAISLFDTVSTVAGAG